MDMMIDIETLSTETPGAAIISVGYLMFDPKDKNHQYYKCELETIHQEKDFNHRKVSWDTVKWHMSLPEGTNSYLQSNEAVSLHFSILCLSEYVIVNKPKRIWSNGICFDISILEDCFKQCNIEIPWRYDQISDARTVYKIYGLNKLHWEKAKVAIKGQAHNPLYDCKIQTHLLKQCIS